MVLIKINTFPNHNLNALFTENPDIHDNLATAPNYQLMTYNRFTLRYTT